MLSLNKLSSECNSYRRQLSIATNIGWERQRVCRGREKNREEFVEKENKKIEDVEHSGFSRAIKDAKIEEHNDYIELCKSCGGSHCW